MPLKAKMMENIQPCFLIQCYGTRYDHFEFLSCVGIFNILNSLKTRMWDQCDSISVKWQADIYTTKQV